jgi:hypothetical protein
MTPSISSSNVTSGWGALDSDIAFIQIQIQLQGARATGLAQLTTAMVNHR